MRQVKDTTVYESEALAEAGCEGLLATAQVAWRSGIFISTFAKLKGGLEGDRPCLHLLMSDGLEAC